MITNNPFSILAETIPGIAMQAFVIFMGLLVILGTLIDIVHKNGSSFKISIDPLENRGFNYHTGLSFTIFSDNLKGEIAKGGRYKTLNGETAIGCTIYTEKIYSSVYI